MACACSVGWHDMWRGRSERRRRIFQKEKMKLRFVLTVASASLVAPFCFAQNAPAMATNTDKRFDISVDECARLSRQALEREGYRIGNSGGTWVYGTRAIHHAFMNCHAVPSGSNWVIVVASSATDAAVPSSERDILQHRMEELAGSGGSRPVLNGRWISLGQGDALPRNAVLGGRERDGRQQAVCHAFHEGNVLPGKTVGSSCNVAYGGREFHAQNFEVLVGNTDENLWAAPTAQGSNFYAGQEGGQQIRACRAEITVEGSNVGLHLGKEVRGHCYMGYGGIEYVTDRYQVLYNSR